MWWWHWFSNLNWPCIPGGKSHLVVVCYTFYILLDLLIFCWGHSRLCSWGILICSSLVLSVSGFWYQDNAGLTKMSWKSSSLFCFLKEITASPHYSWTLVLIRGFSICEFTYLPKFTLKPKSILMTRLGSFMDICRVTKNLITWCRHFQLRSLLRTNKVMLCLLVSVLKWKQVLSVIHLVLCFCIFVGALLFKMPP